MTLELTSSPNATIIYLQSNRFSFFEASSNLYRLNKLFFKKYASNIFGHRESLEPFGRIILVWQTFLWRKVSSVFVGCLKNDERELWVASVLVAKLWALDELFAEL